MKCRLRAFVDLYTAGALHGHIAENGRIIQNLQGPAVQVQGIVDAAQALVAANRQGAPPDRPRRARLSRATRQFPSAVGGLFERRKALIEIRGRNVGANGAQLGNIECNPGARDGIGGPRPLQHQLVVGGARGVDRAHDIASGSQAQDGIVRGCLIHDGHGLGGADPGHNSARIDDLGIGADHVDTIAAYGGAASPRRRAACGLPALASQSPWSGATAATTASQLRTCVGGIRAIQTGSRANLSALRAINRSPAVAGPASATVIGINSARATKGIIAAARSPGPPTVNRTALGAGRPGLAAVTTLACRHRHA
ncbi:hypothetical protein D3C85_1102680 [compost metagenome]